MNVIKKIKNKLQKKVKYDSSFFRDEWFNNWESLKFVLEKLIHLTGDYSNVVDYGCGPGVMIDYMNNKGSCNYYGYDNSIEAYELYKKKYGTNPEKYLKEKYELKSKSWDLFLSFDVLEHMNNFEIEELFVNNIIVKKLFLNISREKHIKGHINIKTDCEWIKYFEYLEFTFNEKETQNVRDYYLTLKPDGADKWNKNMFIFENIKK